MANLPCRICGVETPTKIVKHRWGLTQPVCAKCGSCKCAICVEKARKAGRNNA
jgi:hypothetical protein